MSKRPEKTNEAEQMRDIAVAALQQSKGEDIKVLDVRKLTDVTDIMIVATGTSDRHVKTLATRVLEEMHDAGWSHVGVEGEEAKDWVLVDFVDIVIHVMRAQARERYNLESLWDKTFNDIVGQGTTEEVMESVTRG